MQPRGKLVRHGSARGAAVAILFAAISAAHACADESEHEEQAFLQERCGKCHGMPRASSFPSSEWPTVVRWMSDVARNARDVAYEEAELARITDYYVAHSPEALPLLSPDPARERTWIRY